jgi:hypothetical protein
MYYTYSAGAHFTYFKQEGAISLIHPSVKNLMPAEYIGLLQSITHYLGKISWPSTAVSWFRQLPPKPLTEERPITAEASPCEICGGLSSNGTGFCPSTSVLPCHHHPSNTPYWYFIHLPSTLYKMTPSRLIIEATCYNIECQVTYTNVYNRSN